jgi:hypothetical protein
MIAEGGSWLVFCPGNIFRSLEKSERFPRPKSREFFEFLGAKNTAPGSSLRFEGREKTVGPIIALNSLAGLEAYL